MDIEGETDLDKHRATSKASFARWGVASPLVSHDQVKIIVEQYTVAVYAADFESLTVTSFCMHEVMAFIEADMYVAGISWTKLKGDSQEL